MVAFLFLSLSEVTYSSRNFFSTGRLEWRKLPEGGGKKNSPKICLDKTQSAKNKWMETLSLEKWTPHDSLSGL